MNREDVAFGEISSEEFEVGDIVEWTKWSSEKDIWEPYYGVLISLKNEMRSNRLVSISAVMPLHGNGKELEFFTLSLKLVSRSKEEIM
jgi:hypothetical protein